MSAHSLSFAPTAMSRERWLLMAIAALQLSIYAEPMIRIIGVWWDSEEYGHGLFMPLVAGYIVWLNRDRLAEHRRNLTGLGYTALAGSLVLMLAASLANLESVKLYSLLMAIGGYFLVLFGRVGLRVITVPLLLLFLVIPLPYLLISQLTAGLQLISSELGTWFIRLFGYSVFLEGNLIDMGSFKLAVVEACSGLRYLFPLSSFAVLVAYFVRSGFAFKAILVLATVPVTILMNSLRIAGTGVIVNTFGSEAAEGFLHDFEGWVVFLAALAVLVLIVLVYGRMFRPGNGFHDLFDFEPRKATQVAIKQKPTKGEPKVLPVATLGLASLVAAAVLAVTLNSTPYVPERLSFYDFPTQLGNKALRTKSLSQGEIDILRPDDYFLGDFVSDAGDLVGLYMVYYDEQKEGSALHSPKVCIPGGGWIIADESVRAVALGPNSEIEVNRVVIRKGELTQVVYYWIDQMGQTFTNEYLARASLLKSATLNNRSDGALVRVNTVVHDGDFEAADRQLDEFLQKIYVFLPDYLPS